MDGWRGLRTLLVVDDGTYGFPLALFRGGPARGSGVVMPLRPRSRFYCRSPAHVYVRETGGKKAVSRWCHSRDWSVGLVCDPSRASAARAQFIFVSAPPPEVCVLSPDVRRERRCVVHVLFSNRGEHCEHYRRNCCNTFGRRPARTFTCVSSDPRVRIYLLCLGTF